jgi:hypothetical protein
MAGQPEKGINAELAWDADEFCGLWLALKSRRGAALQAALAKCQQGQEHVSYCSTPGII